MGTVLKAVAVIAGVYGAVGAHAWLANRGVAPELEAEAQEVIRRRADPSLPPSPRPRATRREAVVFFAMLIVGYIGIFVGFWLSSKGGWVGSFGSSMVIAGVAAFVLRVGVGFHIRRRIRRSYREVTS